MLLSVLLIAGVFLWKTTQKIPTCFDGKKNGGESGIDCGGSCLQYCPYELEQPKIRWVRSFEVSPGVVHAVAYIEHSYPGAAARRATYQFKLYDEKNSLITERVGEAVIGPMGRTALIETLIPTGNSSVASTRFSFIAPVPWEKISSEYAQVVIKTDRTVLENFNGGTRLTATVENKSRNSFTAMDIAVLLYDKNGNTITVSKTVLPSLQALDTAVVYFTWPSVIPLQSVSRIEIIPRINPFTATSL